MPDARSDARPDARSDARPTILVVDDDPEIRRLVTEFLSREGLDVEQAEDAETMDALLARRRPDLVVLDLMLPGEDGLSICRRLRTGAGPAILMLTAKSDEIDRVVGLEMGADDYLVKPYGPREHLARIRAVLRRSADRRGGAEIPSRRFAFDAFVIDLDARRLTDRQGSTIALTSGEFDLLACFVQRPRRVLSRDHILDQVRGRGAEPFDRTVDMLVSRLRRKLASSGAEAELIATVRNGGYLFTPTVKSAS
ncbi:MAG: response regulator [Pseudomonadota bacterium]